MRFEIPRPKHDAATVTIVVMGVLVIVFLIVVARCSTIVALMQHSLNWIAA